MKIILFVTAFCVVTSLHAMTQSNEIQEGNNEFPNVSTRLHPSSHELTVFADLIVWTSRVAGADCWAEVITSTGNSLSNNLRQVNFEWDPGFRVGIDYGMPYDQWDTKVYYTWFYNLGKDAVASDPGTVHSSYLGNFYVNNLDGLGLTGPAYQSASIDWTIHFNLFDWELGRNFWVSKALAIRPFLGLKSGWITQSIHSTWNNPNLTAPHYFNVGVENIKNNFACVGPEIGINTLWNLYSHQNQFYLFGDFSGAILWGHWSFSDVYQNTLPQEIVVHNHTINSGCSMIRTFVGFGWDVPFNKNLYLFSLKLGYEMQFWLDQLQFYSFTGGRLVNQLTLQGGTLEFSFDF